ncbi:MAG: porin family protein [Flavobacteriaceae bacterium]|nr:porin family protein [Flavobacteriaceae bacterium]
MKFRFLILAFSIYINGIAQNQTDSLSNYLEDQLYVSIYNNNLLNTPNEFKSYGFSNGISLGFIKDIPLNEQRNVGLGIGLGFAFNTLKNNLKLTENNGLIDLSILNESYDTNKITAKAVEFPIEFRWRTSTQDKFKFWRIYPGMKFSYLYKTEYSYIDSSINYNIKNPEIFNKFQYGFTLNAGYSAFNLYTYFGVKPLYKDVTGSNEKSSIKEIKLGLIFYIL